MTFFDFLESKYIEKNLEIQKQFSLALQAETQACQYLINSQRCVLRWFSYLKLIMEYVFVNFSLLERPMTAKERHEATKANITLVSETKE